MPLHILPHPRHSFGIHQFRNQSTFLGRRTYQSQRLVRYYIGPAAARQYNSERSEYPTRLKSTRMRMLRVYLRDRLINCHRAFATTHPLALDDYDEDDEPVEITKDWTLDNSKQPLTHLDRNGAVHMVEITGKAETKRVAVAVATLLFSNDRTYDALCAQQVVKGNAEAVSRLAAIQAAKKTSDLVPLAHPSLGITAVSVDVEVFGPDDRVYLQKCYKKDLQAIELWSANGGVVITSTVKCEGKTGVEMEAITASTIGAVTMYDMLKAIDKDMVITGARVIRKEGGKSGGWIWDEKKNERIKLTQESTGEPARQEKRPQEAPQNSSTPANDSTRQTTEQSQPPVSDIDEWNEGLVAEFSTDKSLHASSTVGHNDVLLGEERDANAAKTRNKQQTTNHKRSAGGKASREGLTYYKIRLGELDPAHSNTASTLTKDVQDSTQALEARLLAVRESDYIQKVVNDQNTEHDEPLLIRPSEWHPYTMNPITRDDVSKGFKQVDTRDLKKANKKRMESGPSGSGGSVVG